MTGRLAVDRQIVNPGLSWDYRFGHPGTVRVLQSTARMQRLRSPSFSSHDSMFSSLPFRSLNAARSPRSHSLEGFSPTLLEQFPL